MSWLKTLFGVNFKTTIAGLLALLAVGGKVVADFKTKDFGAMIADTQSLLAEVGGLAVGIGLIVAKDSQVTGTGPTAQRPS